MTLLFLQNLVEKQWGSLSESDLQQLATYAPNVKVGFKMGYGSRFVTTAGQAEDDLKKNFQTCSEMGVQQYVRDAFIPAPEMDLLKQFFGWKTT